MGINRLEIWIQCIIVRTFLKLYEKIMEGGILQREDLLNHIYDATNPRH